MVPTEPRESAEVGVGGHDRAPVLDGHRGVLGVRHQLSGCRGFPAQVLEDREVVGTGAHDARRRPFHERRDECKRRADGRWRIEYLRVGRDTDESSEHQHGQGEWFRSGRQGG